MCIVLKNMGENLRKIAMHITNEFVSQAVDQNFHEGAATWCYFDEFHILLRDPLTASYFVAVWKMLRKKGCVPSALTQNVKDLLASREIENILDNTDFMILLSQAQSGPYHSGKTARYFRASAFLYHTQQFPARGCCSMEM